jgi:peptidyl-prolyl cis-trans isomerase B (cyclophilin B)
MRNRQLFAIAAVALIVGVGGAASASGLPRSASTSAMATLGPGHEGAGRHGAPGCGFTPAVPADRYKGLPNYTPAKAARHYVARIQTTQGAITIEALTAQAPCTTFSFRFLAQRRYFDRTHCHRLTTQGIYVLQCGDPTGTGSGGPGYSFNDENLTGATYPAGTVAMANAGPNTNGSQFFIVWKDTTLSPDYTPFGQVIGGMKVLEKIAAAGDDSQNGPGDGYPHRYVGIKQVHIKFSK